MPGKIYCRSDSLGTLKIACLETSFMQVYAEPVLCCFYDIRIENISATRDDRYNAHGCNDQEGL